ncbi:MAG: hypothetical protein A3E79_07800 [Burkholderiales bacterium RIFCSPHIGHO2_12_FULL_61_11]|nr:MAG: hypothetical protein A3E79_07800 [Burkholderiales bacterium RIFCSPHIGHO2_12_FULL_61_11]
MFNLEPLDLITNGVNNILGAIQALAAEGAQHFLIPNMADLGISPEFRNTPDAAGLTGLTAAFNSALAIALTALDQAMNNVEITQFDVFGMVNNVINNPTQYGFTNVTDSCVANLLNGQCDPDTWLFWDGVHPTTAGHALFGAQFATAVPEPASLWLIVTALALLASRRRPQTLRRVD